MTHKILAPSKSMTGFGRSQVTLGGVTIEAEIRAVNGRFLDLICRLPRAYLELESDIRRQVASQVTRGRIEISLRRSSAEVSGDGVVFASGLFQQYVNRALEAGKSVGLDGLEFRSRVVSEILSRREVLDQSESSIAVDSERQAVAQAVTEALSALNEMRATEGQALVEDLTRRLAALENWRQKLTLITPTSSKLLQDKLLARISTISKDVQLDPQRLATEVALLADRVDVTEELVRFGSHIAQFSKTLQIHQSGRKLEFLLQELARESTTLGTKSQDAEIQSVAVEIKAELERMREQVLNLE